jgi:hypothetical protein
MLEEKTGRDFFCSLQLCFRYCCEVRDIGKNIEDGNESQGKGCADAKLLYGVLN